MYFLGQTVSTEMSSSVRRQEEFRKEDLRTQETFPQHIRGENENFWHSKNVFPSEENRSI